MKYYTYLLAACLCWLVCSCSTPKATEQHSHHSLQIDTVAVQRQVDGRLAVWQQRMDTFFSERIDQLVSEQHESEQQHETIHETVTETVDSLGRKVRQEQRTISRDISREMQQTEQRISRQLESRLQCAIDSMDSIWRMRYDSLGARVARSDSSSVSKTPVGDSRPLMQRISDRVAWFGFGVVAMFLIFIFIKHRK